MRSRRTPIGFVAVTAIAALAAIGCVTEEKVVRVIDGRPVAGDFVPADAYAAYLRASIADAAGDLAGAVEGYMVAAALGPRDPEPMARLGDARCRRDPNDPQADVAIDRALAMDGSYAPALEARAHCAERRGDARAAVESARRAMKADPAAVEPLATLARLQASESDAASEDLRARLIALTLLEGTNAAAWDALATWARGHGDALLEARALARLVSLAGSREGDVDRAVARFEGGGDIVAARMLARARVEADAGGAIDPRIARLAIDDALLAGDSSAARRIASRSRIPSVVLAARALLNGDAVSARIIAAMLSEAEPRAIAPRFVLAIANATHDLRTPSSAMSRLVALGAPKAGDAPVPPEVWLAYARALAHAGSPEAARSLVRAIPREPIVAGDSLVTPIAVELAAGGALDANELDPDARIELAARRSEPVADDVVAAADVRHRLLALAMRAPKDPATIPLARALRASRGRDPIVTVAFVRLALAGAIDVPPRAIGDLLARLDPAAPLVAAAALDCAVRAGDSAAIPLARARLAAVAHTPAERARIVE